MTKNFKNKLTKSEPKEGLSLFMLSILVIEDFIIFVSMWNDISDLDPKVVEKRTGKKEADFQLPSE